MIEVIVGFGRTKLLTYIIKAAIALEAERRESADERIFDYANCNFVKYIKKINAAEICPVVELAARTAGPAVPDPNAPTTPTANA